MNCEHAQRVVEHLEGRGPPERLTSSNYRRLLISMQRKGGDRVRANLAGKRVFIWSAEHVAWWRPERAGYTRHIEAAGVYSFEDAWNATRHCGPEKRIAFYVARSLS